MEAKIATKRTRESGVEILKIIAIFLICISHAVQTAGDFIDYATPSLDIQMLALQVLSYTGMIGNTIFVVCSAYFLFGSNKTKWDKVFNLLLDSTLISIACLIGMVIGGYRFGVAETIKQFVPDLFSQMWFVPFYVMLYIAHPILNAGIEKMNNRTYLSLIVVLFLSFFAMTFLLPVPETCNLVYAFVIYLFVGYFRKFHQSACDNRKFNAWLFAIGFGLFLILAIGKYLLGTQFAFFVKRPFVYYTVSPFIAVSAFGLMNLFRGLNVHSKAINFVSSCSLFVYCIHENYLLRTYIRPKVYEWCIDTFGANIAIAWILVTALAMFVGGLLLSFVYKETLHRLTAWVSKLLSGLLDGFVGWLDKKTTKNAD